jgi:hypothetical protein
VSRGAPPSGARPKPARLRTLASTPTLTPACIIERTEERVALMEWQLKSGGRLGLAWNLAPVVPKGGKPYDSVPDPSSASYPGVGALLSGVSASIN